MLLGTVQVSQRVRYRKPLVLAMGLGSVVLFGGGRIWYTVFGVICPIVGGVINGALSFS